MVGTTAELAGWPAKEVQRGGEVGWAAGFVALAASLAAVAEKPVVRVTAVVVAAQAAHTVSPQGEAHCTLRTGCSGSSLAPTR